MDMLIWRVLVWLIFDGDFMELEVPIRPKPCNRIEPSAWSLGSRISGPAFPPGHAVKFTQHQALSPLKLQLHAHLEATVQARGAWPSKRDMSKRAKNPRKKKQSKTKGVLRMLVAGKEKCMNPKLQAFASDPGRVQQKTRPAAC